MSRFNDFTLTKNQQLVFDLLKEQGVKMSAYEILDKLRGSGFSAPPTVYRALDFLISKGLVHKIESLNAFIACDHIHEDEDSVFFEICNDCGETREYSDKKIYSQIYRHTERKNFKITKTTVEILGQCQNCMDS
tara:strand:- start:9712 stop:10113 length:402 start_codon:yes stop_codon:yes gene_type:complete